MSAIFEFEDYKKFVQSWIKASPSGGHGKYREIAKALSAHTTTISQVFNGEKDLTIEQAHLMAEFLGFNALETRYFLLLVQLERAGTHRLKLYYKKEIGEVRDA